MTETWFVIAALATGTATISEYLARVAPDVATVVRLLSVADRFGDFTRGVIALRDLLYFASFIIFFLFLATELVDAKRAD